VCYAWIPPRDFVSGIAVRRASALKELQTQN
jgi:hypothetical protein